MTETALKDWKKLPIWTNNTLWMCLFHRDSGGFQGIWQRWERLYLKAGVGNGHALAGLHAEWGGAGGYHPKTWHGWSVSYSFSAAYRLIHELCCDKFLSVSSGDGQVGFEEFVTLLGPKLSAAGMPDKFHGADFDSVFWKVDSVITSNLKNNNSIN